MIGPSCWAVELPCNYRHQGSICIRRVRPAGQHNRRRRVLLGLHACDGIVRRQTWRDPGGRQLPRRHSLPGQSSQSMALKETTADRIGSVHRSTSWLEATVPSDRHARMPRASRLNTPTSMVLLARSRRRQAMLPPTCSIQPVLAPWRWPVLLPWPAPLRPGWRRWSQGLETWWPGWVQWPLGLFCRLVNNARTACCSGKLLA